MYPTKAPYASTPNNEEEHWADYHLKSHALVYSASSLTAKQMNIVALMLTAMKAEDWQDESGEPKLAEYTFDSSVLIEWFGVTPQQFHATLKQPCEMLTKKTIGIETSDSWRYIPLFSEIYYKKGVLKITPNYKLREYFIVKLSGSGFAKIHNPLFKSLTNPNSKKVFEFLSRFRDDHDMYHISVSKLQILFGIKGENGKFQKPTYASEKTFITKVIKQSLLELKENQIGRNLFTIKTSPTGDVGYELVPTGENSYKIRFLVEWHQPKTEVAQQELALEIISDLQELTRAKKANESPLALMESLEPKLRSAGYLEKADAFAAKIKQIRIREAKARSRKDSQIRDLQKERASTLLNSLDIDSL